MSEPAPLEVRDLSHRFGETPTIGGIDLTIERGQIVAVLGPSGGGKTTLLRSIAGFALPRSGSIDIAGVRVFEAGIERVPAEARRVGMVFQDYALFPHLSVADNVGFGLHRDPERERRVATVLERVGLGGLAARRPAELSGGQQQRVALARALAPRPALLLLDEPFANLDADRRARVIEELHRVLRAEGASVMLVTHNRTEALAISDRVAVLGLTATGGRLLQCASPETVYRDPASADVARITGEAQLVDARARGRVADTPVGRAELRRELHGRVRLLLRPETLAWRPDPDGAAEVEDVQFLGHGYRVWCRTPAGLLALDHADPDRPPPRGARGTLTFRAPCWAFPS